MFVSTAFGAGTTDNAKSTTVTHDRAHAADNAAPAAALTVPHFVKRTSFVSILPPMKNASETRTKIAMAAAREAVPLERPNRSRIGVARTRYPKTAERVAAMKPTSPASDINRPRRQPCQAKNPITAMIAASTITARSYPSTTSPAIVLICTPRSSR